MISVSQFPLNLSEFAKDALDREKELEQINETLTKLRIKRHTYIWLII